MKPVKIFLSYAHEDEAYKNELAKHLQGMVQAGYIETWNDRKILPGQEWGSEIKKELREADLILFLVSSDFIASNFINDVEIATAIEKQKAGETTIVPIIIRPCDFTSTPLAAYQAMPEEAKAVSTWENKDSAWLDVVRELKRLVSGIYAKESGPGNSPESSEYERVKKGKVLYQIPEVMQKDKESKCRVRIAFTEELVRSMLKNTEDITIRGIRISDSMEVELLDPNETPAFAIRTLSSKKQFIDEDDYTEWLFFVRPLIEGIFSLYLKIAIIELVDGEKEVREYVLEEEIRIITGTTPKADEQYAFKSSGYDYNIAPSASKSSEFEATVPEDSRSYPPPESTYDPPVIAPPSPAEAPARSAGPVKKGLAMVLVLVVAFGASYALIPAFQGEIDWALASRKDTRDAYAAYMKKHSERKRHMAEALIKIEDFDWQDVKKDSTNRKVVSEYLAMYPHGRHHVPATMMLENIDWKELTRDSSIRKIDKFIETYPNSPRVEEAKNIREAVISKRLGDHSGLSAVEERKENEITTPSTTFRQMDQITFMTATKATAIRSGLRTNAAVTGHIQKGKSLRVLEASQDQKWVRVEYGDQKGWVKKADLEKAVIK